MKKKTELRTPQKSAGNLSSLGKRPLVRKNPHSEVDSAIKS